MIQFKGARWHKCDLHLHTPASNCFRDKKVSAEQWVQAALDCQLDCVAVTDHNTGAWIDLIKKAAEGKPLVVYPGVEITCDTTKIHLLVIFDRDKDTQYISDFLIELGIRRDDFAKDGVYVKKTCIEVIKFAIDKGAVVIPAHIDEYNGISQISAAALKELYALPFGGVQYVYQPFAEMKKQVDVTDDVIADYNRKYGFDENIVISEAVIKSHYKAVAEAIKSEKSLLCFSDNPESEGSSHHGINGIGKCYTWIKMDSNPSLESLRQSLMIPTYCRSSFTSPFIPYKEPSLWIKSIEIATTTLNERGKSLVVDFNPQFTAVIGGRGSGKSSLFRLIRGVLSDNLDIKDLEDIKQDQEDFFKTADARKGILTNDTTITIELVRDAELHRIIYRHAARTKEVQIFNDVENEWNTIEDPNYLDFFKAELYSQKQIFAISKYPNALRERIDFGNQEIAKLKEERKELIARYKTMQATYREYQANQSIIQKLETEKADLDRKIKMLQDSGIAEEVTKLQEFENTHKYIEECFHQCLSVLSLYEEANSSVNIDFKFDDANPYKDLFENTFGPLTDRFHSFKNAIDTSILDLKHYMDDAYKSLQESQFEQDWNAIKKEVETKKEELEKQGIDDYSNYKKYTDQKNVIEIELARRNQQVNELEKISEELNNVKNRVLTISTEISNARMQCVSRFSTPKVQIQVRKFEDEIDFVKRFREIIQKNTGYDNGIKLIVNYCFGQGKRYSEKYKEVCSDFTEIRKGNNSSLGFDGYMRNLIKGLSDDQWAEVLLLIPEDQIDVLYKPNGAKQFRSIVNASAGQKTTAILSYILSMGEQPLLLDQPEDDLDNRLISDLIVEKIKAIKEQRQIIVITHNANIPVNGDAEYVISMDSNSRHIRLSSDGTIDNDSIKKDVCAVMEGGEQAFIRRAKKYNIKVN